MKNDNLIPVQDFCVHHHIEIQFIDSLAETGVIEVMHIEQNQYFDDENLNKVEMLVRLHQELSIHAEDMDVVERLIDKVASLQNELRAAQQRLQFYERLD